MDAELVARLYFWIIAGEFIPVTVTGIIMAQRLENMF